ncbi:MAG: carbamoyltransferase [Candidatus Melainabacteria bacterium]|nr:carbamoyltransferase [Candidatus Melainabacteria bacterium]
MIILGLNAYHGDSSACIVVDGKVICAIEEERIRRIKHWAGLPTESIKWCLTYAGISLKDVDFIAIARDPSSHLYQKLITGLSRSSMHKFVADRLANVLKMQDIKLAISQALNMDKNELKTKLVKVEHHKAHIASTFLVSPFEEAACISVDGFGDFLSTMRGVGKDNKFSIIDWVEYPHSLGVFYTALTQYLGFLNYGDEYKVMGLSAYGKPLYLNRFREIVLLKDNGLFELNTTYFNHAEKGVEMVWKEGSPLVADLYSAKLIEEFGPPRKKEEDITEHHMNIASSIQAVYEEAFFHLLNSFYEKTKLDSVALAGGCIQNSLANGKIFTKTPFKNIYIPPASYDAGLAIGAAIFVWHNESKSKDRFYMSNPYLGPVYSNDDIQDALHAFDNELKKENYKVQYVESEEDLCNEVASYIAGGKIIGWFQGRTEWGARALGNRSILVDPRIGQMKDVLNDRVKRREWFRPFAPSILEEYVGEWFESSFSVPFMEKVYSIKKDKQKLIPAVCHVDGTGRLQTVSKDINHRYHKLIQCFYGLTGVPLLLNTSFNDNEPIVNSPKDAIQCFLNTKMDALVLGNYIVIKNGT